MSKPLTEAGEKATNCPECGALLRDEEVSISANKEFVVRSCGECGTTSIGKAMTAHLAEIARGERELDTIDIPDSITVERDGETSEVTLTDEKTGEVIPYDTPGACDFPFCTEDEDLQPHADGELYVCPKHKDMLTTDLNSEYCCDLFGWEPNENTRMYEDQNYCPKCGTLNINMADDGGPEGNTCNECGHEDFEINSP